MKILYMHTQPGAIGYYRQFIPARELSKQGYDVTYYDKHPNFFEGVYKSTGIAPENWLFNHGDDFDICHMGYSNVQKFTEMAIAFRNHACVTFDRDMPLITDMDDDPINVPSYNVAYKDFTGQADRKKQLLMQLRVSDSITVTKQEIANVLRDEGKHFDVLPNYCEPLDWDHYPVRPERQADKAVYIMYAGGPAHLGDLALLEEVGPQLTEKYDGTDGKPLLRWIFVGYAPSWAENWLSDRLNPAANRAFFVQGCDLEVFQQAIRWLSPDIFIAPVEQNQFNESKSCIKAYDAVNANAPLVCQDWDTYADIPDDVCFKVRGDVQWLETLSELIENVGLRQKYASKLRSWVLDERQIKDHITKWVDVYEAALKRPVIKELSDVVRPKIIRPDKL